MNSSAVKEFAKKKPVWLKALLSEKFFVSCEIHDAARKNEKNNFCGDCSEALCQHCLPSHQSHWILQIRRYVYHDVIRLHDIQKLVDCSQVQAYIINSAKVVFLNSRPQPRANKGGSNTCRTCQRSLQDSFKFCSVACKVDAHIRKSSLHTILPNPRPSLRTLNLQSSSNDVNVSTTTLTTTTTTTTTTTNAPRGVPPSSTLFTPNRVKDNQPSPNSTLLALPSSSSTHSTPNPKNTSFKSSSTIKDPNSCSTSKSTKYPSKITFAISKSSALATKTQSFSDISNTSRSSNSKFSISSPPKFSSFNSCYSQSPHYSMLPAKVAKLTSAHTSHHLKSPSKFSRMSYGSPTKSSPHHLPKPTTLIATPASTPYMTKSSYYLKPISIHFPKSSPQRGHFSNLDTLPSKRRKGVPNRSPLF